MKKALKISLYVIGGIIALVLIVVALLLTPPGKEFVRSKAEGFLQDKLKTTVRIGKLNYSLPKWISLGDVLILDTQKDTLISAGTLRVDIAMLKLINGKVQVNKLNFENGVAHIYRTAPDTTFNFDFIIQAFASPSPKEEKPVDTSGGMELDIREIALKNIRFNFDDYTGGSRFGVAVGELLAKIEKTDINKMDFRVKRLYVNGLRSSFSLDTSYLAEVVDTTTSPMPMLAADELDLNNISFTFNNNLDKMLFSIGLHQLLAHPKVIDLNSQYITLNDLLLDTTQVKIVMGKKEVIAEKAEEVVDSVVAAKWKVLANSIKLNNINFAMDDENAPRQPYGMDYAHLDVRNLVLDLEQLLYTTDTIAGNLKQLSVKEKSGFDLQKFTTQFAYYPQGAYLNNLYLQTSNTILQDKLVVKYPSLDALKTQMGMMQLQLQLKNSVIGMADILIFAPQLRGQQIFRKYGSDRLKLNTAIEGYVNALNIKTFQLSGLGGTFVDINGKLNGLPDADKLNYNLAIKRLQSQKATVSAFMPASVNQQINLPNTFSITGRVSGNVKDYNTDLLATTTDGNAIVKGKILMSPGAGRERYDVIIQTQNLNVGKILRKDSLMGRITANVSAKGQSFDINKMNAMLRGEIHSAGFMGYNYSAINFDAKVDKKVANVNLISNDPNAVLKLNADADLNGQYPAVVAKLVIDSMDMQALKLYKEELKVRTTVDANLPELNPDYPRGIVNVNRPQVVMSGQRYYLDSIYLSSQPNADSGNFIVLDADAIQAVITGKTPLSKVGTIIQQRIDKYYAAKRDTTRLVATAATKKDTTTVPADYNLNLSAVIRDRPLLRILAPGLQQLDTVTIDGALTPADMYVNVNIPRVRYNDMNLYNGAANVTGRDSALTYDVTLDRFSNSSLEVWYAKVNGSLYDQVIDANVSISDSGKTERFALGATYSQRDTQKVSLKPGLMLNYKTWQVAQPNMVVFDSNGFYVQNIRISNGGESIAINSEAPIFSAPITTAINNFLISNVTEIINKDTLLANGVLNSNMRLQNLTTTPQATGTLSVTNLAVLGDTIGNLDVQLNEASAKAIDSRIAINGRGNDLVVTGFYYPTPVAGNNFDLTMAVNAIDLRSMEGLAQHQIRNSSGYIRGNLKIQGTMTAPKITGELRTDNLKTTPVMLGAPFSFPQETIAFASDGIEFRNFKIVDTLGNRGTISGKILTTNYRDMKLALKIDARKLQVLNSTVQDNKLFYGKMLVSTNMGINGPISAPDINGNLTIHDSTRFTLALPEKEVAIQERDGIVEFVNMRDSGRTLAIKDSVPKTKARAGMGMNLNVGIEKNAEFSVIIDQGTGDFLRVSGEASLNTTMAPDGTVGLTGIYELKDGSYELNYNLIKRKFRIQPGSTITFAGDPLNADVNITAIYEANIAPYDLVTKQIQDPAQLVYYKQRLPFQVKLNMKGSLMKPEVGFDVVLPEDKPLNVSSDVSSLVQAKLSQIRTNASELNKQTFAVLILGRFISDNPFESGSGGSTEYMVRQSASRLIGEQLNKFADQLVQGLELTFDLQSTEDYTTGAKRNRTDLNVAASKRLLNDRLTLTVGNNFELEGQNQNNNQTTSLIPGNLAADYQLSRDGRYMVRIYRRNEMEDILQGFVVETGSNFIVTLNYNKFRNLFNKRQNRENRQRNREMKMEADDRRQKGTAN